MNVKLEIGSAELRELVVRAIRQKIGAVGVGAVRLSFYVDVVDESTGNTRSYSLQDVSVSYEGEV